MSAIVPRGYTRKRIGIFLAIASALLCVLSDVTTNLRNKKKREHREKMLLCPAVKGRVSLGSGVFTSGDR